jgi:hypothetical protein
MTSTGAVARTTAITVATLLWGVVHNCNASVLGTGNEFLPLARRYGVSVSLTAAAAAVKILVFF